MRKIVSTYEKSFLEGSTVLKSHRPTYIGCLLAPALAAHTHVPLAHIAHDVSALDVRHLKMGHLGFWLKR
jgi:hypothetical protein